MRVLLIGALVLLGFVAQPPPTVVYLVRHAERATDHPTDPTLTPEGRARAEVLAGMLADSAIARVYATSYRRTRLTVDPLAARLGLSVEEYDPDAQSALAERIRRTPGRHLVAGHSNTIPELVRLLGGEPGEPIGENEYDRLYVVTIGAGGGVRTTLLRYGSFRVARSIPAALRP
jgi:broad specificity phosphatase PhoE